MIKKIFGVLILLIGLCPAVFFAQGYRIADVRYDLTGSTKAYALKLAVPIDTDTVFPSLEDLDVYVAKISTQLESQRILKESAVTYEVSDQEAGVSLVTLTVTATDSHNWIIVPYPKYSSSDKNTPVEIKLKFKHYNFLGLMQTLDFDINWEGNFGNNNTVGFNLGYAFPFKAGPFDVQWLNDWTFSYNSILEPDNKLESPRTELEFNFSTGVQFVLPLKFVDLRFTAMQYFIMEQGEYWPNDPNNYRQNDDSFYLTEYFGIAAPFALFEFKNLSKLYLTPSLSFVHNWDPDGIIKSPNLQNTAIAFGTTVNNGRIDWDGNFRKGYSFFFGPGLSHNFARPRSSPFIISFDANAQGFWAWSQRVGIVSRLQFFSYFLSENDSALTTREIGGSLRGIRDDQPGSTTPMALIFNLDVPMHLFSTDWRGWGEKLFRREMPGWLNAIDFEVQLSPFFDMAITQNLVAGSTFSFKDGWYSAGLDVLVYPDRWRSLVVRLSLGIDIFQKNKRWWQEEPGYPLSSLLGKTFNEIYFGVGWFY